MTSPNRAFIAVLAGLALAGCQTISEELPTAPTSAPINVPSIPVVVVPVPIPVPSSAPLPVPTTPNPPPNNPAPPRNPAPPANPGNTGGAVRIGAKVYFVERNGNIIPGSEGATEALVGDRIHLDATAKDAQNLPTTTRQAPRVDLQRSRPREHQRQPRGLDARHAREARGHDVAVRRSGRHPLQHRHHIVPLTRRPRRPRASG